MADDICCSLCERTFSQKKSYYRHMRKFHPDVDFQRKNSTISCVLCDDSCNSVKDLQHHIVQQHPDVKLSHETLTFYSSKEFEEWKRKTEEDSRSSFVKHSSGKALADGRVALHYFCHRSGHYLSSASTPRIRRLKARGSHKVGFSCPAHISAYKEANDDLELITVHYQSVHVGHDLEVGRMKLTREQKQKLAESLQLGIPKSKVLSNLARTFSPTKRLSYTTRKDLHNICRDFKIEKKPIFHKDDAVDLQVKKIKVEEDSSMLL